MFLSLKTLGPRWENDPKPGPLFLAVLLAGAFWMAVLYVRRNTGLLADSAKYAMLAGAGVTWALIYVAVKGHDDPPVFALLGLLLWLPALLVYRMPGGSRRV